VAFESRRYTTAEHNYSPTDKEALAVMHALKVWRCYLESGMEVELVTDHHPNTFWMNQTDMSRRRARWAEFLSRFNYTWKYIPGRLNVADPVSRYSAFKDAPIQVVLGAVYVATMTTRRQTAAQAPPPTTAPAPAKPQPKAPAKPVAKAPAKARAPVSVQPAAVPDPQPAAQPDTPRVLLNEYTTFKEAYPKDPFYTKPRNLRDLEQRHGVWWFQSRIAVPDDPAIKRAILLELHDAPYSGHVGVDKTYAACKRQYWWPGMKAYITRHVGNCFKCQSNKARNKAPSGLLMPLPTPDAPWDSVSVDFITCLPTTPAGFDSIVVFVCRLTKMVHLAPTTKEVTAEQTARLYCDNVWKHHGTQLTLISDRGPQFFNRFMTELTRLLGTQQCLSTAYHPQSDGQTERVNRVLQDMLRNYVCARMDDWDDYLSIVEFAINNSDHASTGTSPFMLNSGRSPRAPFEVPTAASRPRNSKVQAAQEMRDHVGTILQEAKKFLSDAKSRMKNAADTKRTDASFQAGDFVMLDTRNLRFKGPTSRKLLPKWLGPYKVSRVVNPVAYQLDLPDTMKCHSTFHISLLKLFKTDGSVMPPPLAVMVDTDGEEWFTIDRVLDHRERLRKTGKATKTTREYRIRWEGYGPEHDTWEPECNVSPSEMGETLRRYWAYRGLPVPKELQ
jgi:hypothetical protein